MSSSPNSPTPNDGATPANHRSSPGFFLTYRLRLLGVFLLSFAAVLAGFVAYGKRMPLEYASTAVLGIPAPDPTKPVDPDVLTAYSQMMESDELALRVSKAMTDEDRKDFLAPFLSKTGAAPPTDLVQLLIYRRWVEIDDEKSTVSVTFEDPEPVVAARIANLFCNECVSYLREQEKAHAAKQPGFAPLNYTVTAATPNPEPYEPKMTLIVSDGVMLGLNGAAIITCVTGIFLHARWKRRH